MCQLILINYVMAMHYNLLLIIIIQLRYLFLTERYLFKINTFIYYINIFTVHLVFKYQSTY